MSILFIIKFITLITFFISGNLIHIVSSDTTAKNDVLQQKADTTSIKEVKNRAFKEGEELTFKIRYGFITAGSAKMKVLTANYNNQKVYHLQTTAKSAGSFDWIYEVRDEVNSYVDYKYFYPLRFEKKLREGSYKVDLLTDYFPDELLAKVDYIRYDSDMKEKKRKNYDVTVPAYVQDILSSFYYIRLLELKIGRSVFLTNHEKEKVYNLEVLVHPREIVEVEAGMFSCIVVEPLVQGEGLFKKKGSLRVWLTDDDRKIPVQMKSEVLVGHITTELIKIKGVEGPIQAKLK